PRVGDARPGRHRDHGPQRARVMTTTAVRGPSVPGVGWLLGVNMWMVTLLFPYGSAAWIGFIVAGAVGRRLSWALFGVGYGIAAIVLAADPIASSVVGVIVRTVFTLGLVVHGLIISPAYSRRLWARRLAGPSASADAARGTAAST